MAANRNKCHLLISGKTWVIVNVNCFEIKNSECETLIAIKVDRKLKFKNYLDS